MKRVTARGLVLLAVAAACGGHGQIQRGQELPSPEGEFLALFFSEHAGGAAGSTDQYVSVRPRGAEFDPDDWVLFMSHGYEVCLRWTAPAELLVLYPAEAHVHERKDRALGDRVHVRFDTRPSQNGKFVTRSCE